MGATKRMSEYLDLKGISKYKFCKKTGLSNGILDKNRNLGSDKCAIISEKFPDINPDWLLTGNGEMLRSGVSGIVSEITGYYYPEISAIAGFDFAENNDHQKIAISLPNWGTDIIFINVKGDSMYPKYNAGDIIGIKEVELQYINYGYVYVVVLADGEVFLKYLKKGKNDQHIVFVSENDFYDPKEYNLKQIKQVYLVKGSISKSVF